MPIAPGLLQQAMARQQQSAIHDTAKADKQRGQALQTANYSASHV